MAELTPSTAYTGALGRYATSKKQAMDKMSQAEAGYGDLTKIYAPGGSYGAGQVATINREVARGVSTAQAGAIGSGMSSSTNAQGMGARFMREGTQAKLGVEDTRADKYAGVLQGLASLRMSAAGEMGSLAANEPSYAPFASTQASMYGTSVGAQTQRSAAALDYQGRMNTANLAAQTQQAIAQMQIDADQRLLQTKLGSNVGGGVDTSWL